MARPKKVGKEQVAAMKFAVPLSATAGDDSVQVSARVRKSLKLNFDEAVELAKKHGFDVPLNRIIAIALQDAIAEVEQITGKSVSQLNLQVDENDGEE
jgi:hypothetical protein